jgi:hypothetical protein
MGYENRAESNDGRGGASTPRGEKSGLALFCAREHDVRPWVRNARAQGRSIGSSEISASAASGSYPKACARSPDQESSRLPIRWPFLAWPACGTWGRDASCAGVKRVLGCEIQPKQAVEIPLSQQLRNKRD